MSVIPLKRKHTRKPNYPVGIDWSNPLSKGLKIFVATPFYNSVTGKMEAAVNGAAKTRNVMVFDGTDDRADGKVKAATGSAFTVASKYKSGSAIGSASRYLLNIHRSADPFAVILWHYGAASEVRANWSLNGYASFLHEPAAGEASKVIISVPSSTYTDAYALIDGVIPPINAGTSVPFSATTDDYSVGGRSTGARYWDGDIEYVAKWSRALSAAEQKSFQENPYQILQPRTQYIPIAAAASGRIMGSLAGQGGLAGNGGIAGIGGGCA